MGSSCGAGSVSLPSEPTRGQGNHSLPGPMHRVQQRQKQAQALDRVDSRLQHVSWARRITKQDRGREFSSRDLQVDDSPAPNAVFAYEHILVVSGKTVCPQSHETEPLFSNAAEPSRRHQSTVFAFSASHLQVQVTGSWFASSLGNNRYCVGPYGAAHGATESRPEHSHPRRLQRKGARTPSNSSPELNRAVGKVCIAGVQPEVLALER